MRPAPMLAHALPPRAAACRDRRGMALPTALIMLVVMTALAGGAFAMSRQTFRAGRNALVEQRAFAVAEAGLNRQIAGWNPAFNLPSSSGGVGIGIDSTRDASIFVADGDTAEVRVTRLDPMLFWVQSFGRANIPRPMVLAARNVGSLVRIAYPSITPQGAITTNGDVRIDGAAFRVDGNDEIPYAGLAGAWDSRRCTGLTGPNVHAIAVPPGARVNSTDANFLSPMRVLETAAAGDSNTYIAFGTETMNTLIQNADIKLAMSGTRVDFDRDIEPRVDAGGVCTREQTNWGEPGGPDARPAVEACRNRFPIIYSPGDLVINGGGRGQGILIVNGDLRLNGNFDWLGLVLVRDDMNKGTGNATIRGAVMARNVDLRDGSGFGGSQEVHYSRCAVESALRGSAILIRVRDRAWAQLF